MIDGPFKPISKKEDEKPKKRTREEQNAIMQNHEALLVLHSHRIRRLYASPAHACRFDGCNKAGSISQSTKGDENYFCCEHFRMI